MEKAKSWAHFDVYAWNPKPRAHGPTGGEIQAARALFELLGSAIRGGEADLPNRFDLRLEKC